MFAMRVYGSYVNTIYVDSIPAYQAWYSFFSSYVQGPNDYRKEPIYDAEADRYIMWEFGTSVWTPAGFIFTQALNSITLKTPNSSYSISSFLANNIANFGFSVVVPKTPKVPFIPPNTNNPPTYTPPPAPPLSTKVQETGLTLDRQTDLSFSGTTIDLSNYNANVVFSDLSPLSSDTYLYRIVPILDLQGRSAYNYVNVASGTVTDNCVYSTQNGDTNKVIKLNVSMKDVFCPSTGLRVEFINTYGNVIKKKINSSLVTVSTSYSVTTPATYDPNGELISNSYTDTSPKSYIKIPEILSSDGSSLPMYHAGDTTRLVYNLATGNNDYIIYGGGEYNIYYSNFLSNLQITTSITNVGEDMTNFGYPLGNLFNNSNKNSIITYMGADVITGHTLTILPGNSDTSVATMDAQAEMSNPNGYLFNDPRKVTNFLEVGFLPDSTLVSSFQDIVNNLVNNYRGDPNNNPLRLAGVGANYGDYLSFLFAVTRSDNLFFSCDYDTTKLKVTSGSNTFTAYQVAGTTAPMLNAGDYKVWRISIDPVTAMSLSDTGSILNFSFTDSNDISKPIKGMSICLIADRYGDPAGSGMSILRDLKDSTDLTISSENVMELPVLMGGANPSSIGFRKILPDTTTSILDQNIGLGSVAINSTTSANFCLANSTGMPVQVTSINVLNTTKNLNFLTNASSTFVKNTVLSDFTISYGGATLPAVSNTSYDVVANTSLGVATLDVLTFKVQFNPKLKVAATPAMITPYNSVTAPSIATMVNDSRSITLTVRGSVNGGPEIILGTANFTASVA